MPQSRTISDLIKMSKFEFYADFFIYPIVLFLILLMTIKQSREIIFLVWVSAAVSGVFVWSFLEYVMHRFVLHKLVYLERLHIQHHLAPHKLIGTPTWLSLAAFVSFVYLPLIYLCCPSVSYGFSFGLTSSYSLYVVLHFILHHSNRRRGCFLSKYIRMHALHHHALEGRNFGVTSLLWDHVFGTSIK
jgi:sterol desaturase/sphingolipid hydroxylase (fatty acid hydroxylase superfamily)